MMSVVTSTQGMVVVVVVVVVVGSVQSDGRPLVSPTQTLHTITGGGWCHAALAQRHE